jgi:hypothetical protein
MCSNTVVLVEGGSDREAILALARLTDTDLSEVEVVVLDGATKLGAFTRRRPLDGLRVFALCDAAEAPFFTGVVAVDDLFVCDPDLEAELIAAAGVELVEKVIEESGELRSLRRLQMQPQHRKGLPERQLHRFMGSRSGRKAHYARTLVEALGPEQAPRPLTDLVASLRLV